MSTAVYGPNEAVLREFLNASDWRAELYLPNGCGARVPAIVIINSSAGVCDIRERFYARFFSERGIAALVVDSFGLRGVTNTIEDQSLVPDQLLEADAYEAFELLARDHRIDADSIGIMGVSKGGQIALNTSLAVRRQWFHRPWADFAAHIALAPPAHMQQRNARTNGRPILLLLAERDDFTGVDAPMEYARRMAKAGNPRIRTRVYRGAHHAWELTGPVVFLEKAENYSRCHFLVEDDGSLTDRDTQRRMTLDVFFLKRSDYLYHGAHAGGGTEELKHDAAMEILNFFHACL